MSLYRCTRCDAIENTATGGYWEQEMAAYQREEKVAPLCSECFTGKWHGQFPKRGITAEWLQDRRGFLWKPDEAKTVPHLGPFTPVEALLSEQEKGNG